MLQKMNTAGEEDSNVSVCANCGKEGNDINNICNKCKQVKYCNAVCKKIHKKKHKKECEEFVRRADEKHNEELRIAAELHDEKLFKQPPPLDDCPICFLRIPTLHTGRKYMSCCGKVICSGCIHAPVYDDQGNRVDIVKQNECPFCRVVAPKSEKEVIERTMKRVEANDPSAIYNLGTYYREGINGYPVDYTKALEVYHKAAELGYAKAYNGIGYCYLNGKGVESDKKKAIHYFELAAMRGNAVARYNLGLKENDAGNVERAVRHFMIAARSGESDSLKEIQKMYSKGQVTKEDYTKALQLHQEYLEEIKSIQRDKAAAADEAEYRYY